MKGGYSSVLALRATRYGTSQLAEAGQRLSQEPGLGGRGGGGVDL